jgi:hypothetical protein
MGASSWAGEPEIPLPPGVASLSEPSELTIGSTPLQVQGFSTTMGYRQLRAFYEKALPKAGWRIEPLPWQAHHARVERDFDQASRRDREAAEDPQMQAMKEKLDRTSQSLERQLYARYGNRQLIMNFTTVGDRRVVFLNQWNGRAEWMEMRPASAAAGGTATSEGGAWPKTNACCSDESVSETEVRRILPTTIPPYPGARVIATNRSASGESRVAVMETPDDRTLVEQFYSKHLAYNGWTELAGAAGRLPRGMVMYEKDELLCGLALASAPTAADGTSGPSTVITIHVLDRVARP